MARVGGAAAGRAGDLVVAVAAGVDVSDWQQVFFHMCANIDTARDFHHKERRLGIDATTKLPGDERHGRPVRDFPPFLEMSDAIRARVTERRPELGLP